MFKIKIRNMKTKYQELTFFQADHFFKSLFSENLPNRGYKQVNHIKNKQKW